MPTPRAIATATEIAMASRGVSASRLPKNSPITLL